jgi:integrase
MGKQVLDVKLSSREARSKLERKHDPRWREIIPGLHIGYRKGKRGGVWYGRKYLDEGKYQKWRLGIADDIVDSDGIEVLTFTEADAKVRLGPSGTAGGKVDTVNDVMTYYMKRQEAESRSPKTTQYAVDRYITPTIGKKRLAKLTIDNITEWRNDLAKPKKKITKSRAGTASTGKTVKYSPRELRRRRQASANRVLTILKAALNYAERTGKYRGPAPWKLVSPFKNVDATEHPYLTRDEAIRLQNACAPDIRLLVRGALETGCRYGELTSMKATDFNTDVGIVVVRESKSGKVRHVHLTDSGHEFFDELVADKKHSEFMFLKNNGGPWGKSNQIRPMNEACEIAKISPPIPFKALRTTYGSLLAKEGVPLQVIAAALGHADTRITEKHYAHLMPNYVADTIRAKLPTFSDKKSKVRRIKRL